MPSRKARTLLLACGVCLAVIPAVAARSDAAGYDATLPPGFGDPKAPPPPPAAPPPPPSVSEQPVTPEPTRPRAPSVPNEAPDVQETTDSALTDLELLPPPPPAPLYDIPQGLERPVNIVGVIDATQRGLPADAFGDANGAFLITLMQRLDAPLPSRWMQIALRRALLSRVNAPLMADPVDFVAARVRLLVRMGEADAARMLAQAIDVSSYNPAMVLAGYEAALASADPEGLCPLVQAGRAAYDDPAWPMAEAMCAAMEGEAGRAGALLDEARREGARGVDLLLAEKIVGAGQNSGRAVEIEWDEVPELNLWRFGLASAAGTILPDRLLAAAGPRALAWLARAPMVPVSNRLLAGEFAARLGVFSSASLVNSRALAFDMQAAAGEAIEADSLEAQLAAAYAGDEAGRIGALRDLWGSTALDGEARYARFVLAAGAAALVDAAGGQAGDADQIVASLLAAGMDGEAAAWTDAVEAQGGSTLGWALLAVGAPRLAVDLDGSRIRGFAGGNAGELRARMLAAALAGLGRMDEASAIAQGIAVGRTDAWTDALASAAAARQPGTVVLLAATGLQAPDWRGVPPEHLYHITRALRQVGLDQEARMIAAEALTRL